MSGGMRADHPPLLRNRPLLRRIGQVARPYRRTLGLLAVVVTLATTLPLAVPLILRRVIDDLAAGRSFDTLRWPLAIIAICVVAAVLFDFLSTRLANDVGHQVINDLQCKLYDHLSRMPIAFYATVRQGTVASRLTNDVYATEPLFTSVLVTALANTLTLLTAAIVLAVVDIRLTLVLLLIPLVLYPVRKSEARINAVLGASFRYNAELTAHVESTLHRDSIILARQAGRSTAERRRFATLATTVRDNSIALSVWRASVGAGYGIVFAITYAAMLIFGVWSASSGAASIGTVVLFLLYLRQIQTPVTALIGLRYPSMRAGAAFGRVFDVVESDLRPEPEPFDRDRPARSSAPVLVFEQVGFRHEPADRVSIPGLSHVGAVSGPGDRGLNAVAHGARTVAERVEERTILRDISFAIRVGETVAITGASGAGKSTLAMLAAALIRPTSGRILVNGRDTCDNAPEDLAGTVALITQEAHLLHGTLADNIRYVSPDASDADVERVCRAAQLDDVVALLPAGLATVVGEKGYRLSGGERQRVAIARALLGNVDLVILDEPTSQLDADTERNLLAALLDLFAERAVLIITHRPAAAQAADRVVVLEDGTFLESGARR